MAIAAAIILPIGLIFLLSGLIINFIQVCPFHPCSNNFFKFFFGLDLMLLLLFVEHLLCILLFLGLSILRFFFGLFHVVLWLQHCLFELFLLCPHWSVGMLVILIVDYSTCLYVWVFVYSGYVVVVENCTRSCLILICHEV